ncbi:MAG: RNase adapter RapZ [Ruminococcaceae bacterium]|nr:RNase adapter RapZ [Oscillospiraceae bacterium]
MEFVIISGMSGAGKSRAASFMEDMGYFCVDNLPVPLIAKFAELGMAGSEEYGRVVLVTDVRAGAMFDHLFQVLDELETMKCPYRILFMDAGDNVIIKRYKESRRSHPLAEESESLEDAIARERSMLQPLRQRADYIIDTSQLPTAKLKGELSRLFSRDADSSENMQVNVMSFGFKHGLPLEADLVFDVRFLPNPFYIAELRHLTGLDAGVQEYVFRNGQAQAFLDRLNGMLEFLLPRYVEEGKTALVIAVGCTGGHHRSVAITHELAQTISGLGYMVAENHRDLGRN